jgi:D-alanyl-D-alanine dipeptidase
VFASADLDALIAYEVADKVIPSISYVLFDRRDVLALRHVGGALDEAARFRIGSISKTFAAIAAMQLVASGKLDLEAPVDDHVPGIAPHVTLGKLLSHRSGLTREAGIGHYLDDSAAPLAQTVDSLRHARFKAPVDGSAHAYSNAGFALVGAAVEAAGGRPYAEQLADAVLRPLGLDETAIMLTPEVRAHLAAARVWTLEEDRPAPLFDLGSAPAGNLTATLGDLARYGQALLQGGEPLLPPPVLERMWAPAGPAPDPARGYGLGFSIDTLDGRRLVGHGGAVYGYASTLQLLPGSGLGIAMIATLDFTNELVGRLARYALRLALAQRNVGRWPRPPRRLMRPTTAAAAELTGTYCDPSGARIELRAARGGLHLIEDGLALEIRPVGETAYVLDGRIHGEGTAHPDPDLVFPAPGRLRWRGRDWTSALEPLGNEPPPAIAPYLGRYAPVFAPTELIWSNGRLVCLIEYFCPHVCEPSSDTMFVMHGSLYEAERLELGVTDALGRPAIRVGEMLLARLG